MSTTPQKRTRKTWLSGVAALALCAVLAVGGTGMVLAEESATGTDGSAAVVSFDATGQAAPETPEDPSTSNSPEGDTSTVSPEPGTGTLDAPDANAADGSADESVEGDSVQGVSDPTTPTTPEIVTGDAAAGQAAGEGSDAPDEDEPSAVDAVIAQIDALTETPDGLSAVLTALNADYACGAITAEEFGAREAELMADVWAAADAFDALSEEEQALVTNYGVLAALLAAYYSPVATGDPEPVYVARIGDALYETIDDAIAAAANGDTVTLLDDVVATKTFYKSLTFDGEYSEDSEYVYTLSMDAYGWRYNGDLVFDGVNFAINSDADSPVANNGEAGRWFTMVLGGSLTATNGANVTFTFDSVAGTNCAIYTGSGGVTINVQNGSTFSIFGKNTQGVAGQGIQLDSTADTGIFVTGGSTFLIDGTNRGYVNSPTIYVEESTFTVQNCTSNASNGGAFTAILSKVYFLNNAGHGLSATTLDIEDYSELVCNGNGYYGVTVGSRIDMDGTSKLTSNGNGRGYTGGALCLANSYTMGTFEAKAEVTLQNNVRNALENYGTCTFEDGVVLTITGNYEPNNGAGVYNGDAGNLTLPANAVIQNNTAGATGGGIRNKGVVTVPASVQLYNNHAGTAGDDIYNTGVITFGPVGEDWYLDGAPDCESLIDGWYEDGAAGSDDAAAVRWNAHTNVADDQHVVLTEAGRIEGLVALKAAHGLTSITITKVWDDDDDRDAIRPERATIAVYENDAAEVAQVTLTQDDVDENGNWTTTVDGLSLCNGNGDPVFYVVQELEVAEGYTAFTSRDDETKRVFTVTNTHTPETVDIVVNKVWEDGDNQDNRPQQIALSLYADGEPVVESVEVQPDENGVWSYTFAGQPKYNGGDEIEYTVLEDAVSNYATKYVRTATETGTVVTIVNSYTPGKTSVNVIKKWNDNNNRDGLRPTSVTVNLLVGEQIVATAELSEANNWAYCFTNLDINKGGSPIKYEVEEVVPEGYSCVITGGATSGFVIENRHLTYTITVNYLDAQTGDPIADPVVFDPADENAPYDATEYDKIAISGYTYDSTTGDPLTGTLDGDKVINVYYTKDATSEEPAQPEEPATPEQPAQPQQPSGPEVPKTADETNAALPAGLALGGLVLAGAAAGLIVRSRMQRSER